jgi:hypothetical protein
MDTALNLRDIEKVTIGELRNCQFPAEEIYTRDEDKRVRFLSLDKAVTMSRNEKVNTLLVVNTTKGFKAITTKVLGLNMQGITITENMFIPMSAVYSVNIE